MLCEQIKVEDYRLDKLTLDKTVQLRASLNHIAVADYAEAMEAGDEFPPIVVYFRFGGPAYVADGFHRVAAAQKIGLKKIKAEVRDGSRRDAILYAARANAHHGVRRTADDKRKAVLTLLQDAEWKKWTDTTLAKACGVTPYLIKKYRDWLRPAKQATKEEVRSFVDSAGLERTRTVHPQEEVRPQANGKCPYCGQPMKGNQ